MGMIRNLNLTVQYQSADRLVIRVTPTVIDSSKLSQYILPEYLVHPPTAGVDANSTTLASGLDFVWSNDSTFSFSVFHVSTGDTLFSTVGTKLVFEDQFVDFVSTLPEHYNLSFPAYGWATISPRPSTPRTREMRSTSTSVIMSLFKAFRTDHLTYLWQEYLRLPFVLS